MRKASPKLAARRKWVYHRWEAQLNQVDRINKRNAHTGITLGIFRYRPIHLDEFADLFLPPEEA